MVNGTAAVLEPTFTGYIATTQDALILFEACLTGILHHVPRRPHDRERDHLVRSGSIFIYEENASGIKRWTDGVTWSPSRILGNFLVYRELEKPFPPGEKKRAMKRACRYHPCSGRGDDSYPPHHRHDSGESSSSGSTATITSPGTTTGHPLPSYPPSSSSSPPTTAAVDRSPPSEVERALVGSLVDSYGFKNSGLVKKTMSVTVAGVTHHLVSYYSVEDVLRGSLMPPSMVESLRYIRPRPELTQKQSFRAPIDELDTGFDHSTTHDPMYGYRPQFMGPPGYAIANPHSEFYMHTASPYAATTASTHSSAAPSHHPPPPPPHHPQSGPIPSYGIGAPFSASHSTPNNPYVPISAPLSHKPDEYSAYRTTTAAAAAAASASPYGTTGFEPTNQNGIHSSIPPATMNIGSIPSSLSDRSRSHSEQSPSAYHRNSSISSRSIATDATSPIDPTSTPTAYSRNSFSVVGGGAFDGPTPAAFDPTVPRRDSNPISPSYYAGAGADERHPYYAASQPLSAWTTAAPAQPQI